MNKKIFLKNKIGLKRGALELTENKNWVFFGKEIKQKLENLTGESFEHVGSTAVIGLKAKPILDFLLTYRKEELSQKTIKTLEDFGFAYKGDIISKVQNTKEKMGRHFFALYDKEKTIDYVHIHALPSKDPEAKNLVLFRDCLREDTKKIEIYNNFKQNLLDKKTSREAYRLSKSDLIETIIGKKP